MTRKIFGNILFWSTLISPMVAFSIASTIGESNIFGVAGIVRYSWIMLLFIPIGILSIIIGIKLKNSQQKYKKNYIIALVCIPLLVIFGSYRFVFHSIISYNDTYVRQVEHAMDYSLPENLKVATLVREEYTLTYAKICNQETREQFESGTLKEVPWKASLPTVIRGSLPMELQPEFTLCDYFLVYNVTANRFDAAPLYDGQWSFILVGYDMATSGFVIVSDYTVEFSS